MTGPLRILLGAADRIGSALDWRSVDGAPRDSVDFHIQPYRGHGTAEKVYLSGRVLRGSPVPPASDGDSAILNLRHALRRLGSVEVPGARVRATLDGIERTVVADDTGLIEVEFPIGTNPICGEAWRPVRFDLIDPVSSSGEAAATGFAIVPPPAARFGIISDIDDTIVETNVARISRMVRLVMLTNARTRLPFAGVAAFYRALHEGAAGPFTNPIFYVSSSPWNFYDLLVEAFDVHDIPVGPLYLKDFGVSRDLILSRGHRDHKLSAIERIFATHARLPFVLVGDSGQMDPEIYREVVRRHPDRVLAIYIRDVSKGNREAEVGAIAADLVASSVEMILVPDTVTAAEHAATAGLIDSTALSDIRTCREDELKIDR